jgi:hypothetical protein
MATSYSLREQQEDYQNLADIPLPRIQATKRVDNLYQLEIINEEKREVYISMKAGPPTVSIVNQEVYAIL